MDIDARVTLAGNAAANAVDHAEDHSPLGFGLLDGSQCVGRLTALRDGHHDVVGLDDGVAVAKLRGIGHLHRDAAEVLQILFANEAGVPRSAAGDDDDAARSKQFAPVLRHSREYHLQSARRSVVARLRRGVRRLHDAAAHAVPQYIGLVEDFLEHEVVEAVVVEHREVEIHLLHLALGLFARELVYLDILAA